MVRRAFLQSSGALLLLIYFGYAMHARSVFAETPAPAPDHAAGKSGPPAPPPRGADAGTAPVATGEAIQKLQNNPGTPAWWKTAHGLLEKTTSKTDAEKFLNDPAFTNQSAKDLFRELIWARFIDDPQKLRAASQEKTATPRREASKQEILRRIGAPDTLLIAKAFGRRPELAMIDTPPIASAKDDATAAKGLATLFGRINTVARKALNESLSKSEAEIAKALGIPAELLGKADRKLLERLKEAAQVGAGGEAKTDFQKAFKAAYDPVVASNRQTHDLIAKAALGDPAARAELNKKFSTPAEREEINDYIAMAMRNKGDGDAVTALKAFAERDKDGNLSATFVASNAGFGDKNRVQTAFLGNEKDADLDQQLRGFINTFNTRNAVDHGMDKDFDAGTTDGLQLVSLDNSRASEPDAARIYAGVENGKNVIRRATAPGNPGQPLAKETVENPVLIVVPTPTPTPTVVAGSPNNGGAINNATVSSFVVANCQRSGCHGTVTVSGTTADDMRILIGGSPRKFSEVVANFENNQAPGFARMKDLPQAVKDQLKAWAALQR